MRIPGSLATDEALKQVYGFDVDGLDERWRTGLAVGAGGVAPGGPAQPEGLPVGLIAGFAVAAVAVALGFARRRVTKASRPPKATSKD